LTARNFSATTASSSAELSSGDWACGSAASAAGVVGDDRWRRRVGLRWIGRLHEAPKAQQGDDHRSAKARFGLHASAMMPVDAAGLSAMLRHAEDSS
jgi:hypothetical protein